MQQHKRTPAQLQAINSEAAMIFCLAGPGSGKTTVLTERILRLVTDGADPSRTVVLTYTNNAARELEERLCLNPLDAPLGFIGTRHGFALRMLRRYGGNIGYGERLSIIDEDAAEDLLASKARTLGCKLPARALHDLKKKGRPLGPQFTTEELVIVGYLDDLREAGIVDLDSILPEFLRMIRSVGIPSDFDHYLVDETQDNSDGDWDIDLAIPAKNKFFVGDPDQAIYGFRGGNVRRLLDILHREDLDCQMIALEDNFRSTPAICEAANRLIVHNRTRVPKRVKSARADTSVHADDGVRTSRALSAGAEAADVTAAIHALDSVQFNEIAVISRTNAIASEMRAQLSAAGIPVSAEPKPDIPRDWLFTRATVELLANPDNDTVAFFYLIAAALRNGVDPVQARQLAHKAKMSAASAGLSINRCADGLNLSRIGLPLVIKELEQADVTREARMLVAEKIGTLPAGSTVLDLALALASTDRGKAERSEGVTCTTPHGAKGLEWDCVFVVGAEAESWPGKRGDIEEERRLMFVAITRARRALFISSSATRQASWGYRPIEPRTPSPFIGEIEGRSEA